MIRRFPHRRRETKAVPSVAGVVLCLLLPVAVPPAPTMPPTVWLPVPDTSLSRPNPRSKPQHDPAGPIANDGRVPQDVVAADFNRDGLADLAIAFAFDDSVRWYAGTGEGGFTLSGEIEVGRHAGPLNDLPRALVAHDFDGDGLTDLAVLCSGNPQFPLYTSPSLGILYGTPAGAFEPFQSIELSVAAVSPPRFSTVLAAGPLDADNHWDLVVGHRDSRQFSVIEYAGGRRWKPPTLYAVPTGTRGPTALALADLDFDGAVDLLVANREDLQIWRGDGQGHFQHRTTFASGTDLTALAAADFDSDGDWDLAALDGAESAMLVFMGLTLNGQARRVASIPLFAGTGPVDLVRYDADLDGRDDLALVYFVSGGADLFLGQRRGARFPLVMRQHFATALAPRAIAAADFDSDGRADLAVVHQGDEIAPDNEDLALLPNRLPIGARSEVAFESSLTPGVQFPPYLSRPRGLGWDAGRQALWTLDRLERRLVRLSVEGRVETSFSLAGLTEGRLRDPADVAVDRQGHVWISDRLGGRVYRVQVRDSPGPLVNSFSTEAFGLTHPSGMTFDRRTNRLLVSDERTARIGAFSPGGTPMGLFQIRDQRPLRDLACSEATGRLWAVRADGADELIVVELDERTSGALLQSTFPASCLAPLLSEASPRSMALDASGRSLWLLTASGTLIRADLDAADDCPTSEPIRQMHELGLLREIAAVTLEPDGSLLLADAGLLGTLVRADARGVARDVLPLNSAHSQPVVIAGLTRKDDRICVLDGHNERILVYDAEGRLEATLGQDVLRGRRPRGLHWAPRRGRFFVGTTGRLVELAGDGALIAEHRIRASAPPGSLSSGPQAGHVLVFSPPRRAISLLTETLVSRAIFVQTRHFPPRFVPRAAAGAQSADRLVLVGAGDPTVLLTRLIPQPSAARRHWPIYR